MHCNSKLKDSSVYLKCVFLTLFSTIIFSVLIYNTRISQKFSFFRHNSDHIQGCGWFYYLRDSFLHETFITSRYREIRKTASLRNTSFPERLAIGLYYLSRLAFTVVISLLLQSISLYKYEFMYMYMDRSSRAHILPKLG